MYQPWTPQYQHYFEKHTYSILNILKYNLILIKCQIGYFEDNGDTLICDQSNRNIEKSLNRFSELQPSIKFTMENELHNSIHFLDLTLHCKDTKLNFSVYAKPTKI